MRDSIYQTPMPLIPQLTPRIMVRILAETVDYNHQLMNIPAIWQDTMGEKVRVAVLDTGLPKHVDLVTCGSMSFIPGYLEDLNGHGTHVAGIIAAVAHNGMGVAGIAPGCEDYYGAVLDQSGCGTIDNIIAGIRWAVETIQAKVINISLGVPAGIGTLTELEAACNYAFNAGVTVVCAAGNEAGAVGQPACYDSVLAVAAVNSKKEHAAFSDFGPEIDFACGGVDVFSTWLNNGYCKLSGTSMSSPALSGVVALILADEFEDTGRWLTPMEVTAKLKKIAFDVTPEGFDEFCGNGIPVFQNGSSDVQDPTPCPVPEPVPVPVPDPVQPPNSDSGVSPCNMALPLLRQFTDAATKAKNTGKSDQESIMAGVSALQSFMMKVDSLTKAGKA